MAKHWKVDWVKIHTDIIERKDLSGNAKLVYAAIRDAIGKNERAWPGLRTLAKRLGICTETVIQSVDVLERCGALVVIRSDKRGRSNGYRLPESVPDSGTPDCPRNQDTPTVLETRTPVLETSTQVYQKLGRNQKTHITRLSISPKQVESVYAPYPNKVGKSEGLKAIRKAIRRVAVKRDGDVSAAVDFLVGKVRDFAASVSDVDRKYIKYPQGWFNGERYLDETFEQQGRKSGLQSTAEFLAQ